MLYFTSDLHFNHQICYNYRKDHFKSLKDMNSTILYNITHTVPENATLYILGDIFKADFLGVLKPMNYKLRILLGNHDRDYDKKLQKSGKEWIKETIDMYDLDAIIIDEPIAICGGFIYISHEPLGITDMLPNCINLYGHVHPGENFPKLKPIKKYIDGGRSYNCTLDYNDFKPISILEIYNKLGLYDEPEELN